MNIVLSAEKTWALALRELRLLGRSRSRLLCAVIVPVVGGAIAGRAAYVVPAAHSLFVFLPLCAILFAAAGSTTSGGEAVIAVRAITSAAVRTASWTLAALMLLVVQAGVLTASARVLGGFDVKTGIVATAVGVSLAAGSIARRFLVPE